MKCMIDANIILDVLCKRKPHYISSSKVWKLCETNQIEGFVSVLTFVDIIYILRKQLDPEQIEYVLNSMKLIFNYVELSIEDLSEAASLRWDDYEDALQEVSAKRIKADYIITRNIKDYEQSKLIINTPEGFLSILN